MFSQADNIAADSQERRKIHARWKNPENKERVFSGLVRSIKGPAARAMAVPDNFEASFWRNRPELSELREGDPLKFYVRFNAQGPTAHIIL